MKQIIVSEYDRLTADEKQIFMAFIEAKYASVVLAYHTFISSSIFEQKTLNRKEFKEANPERIKRYLTLVGEYRFEAIHKIDSIVSINRPCLEFFDCYNMDYSDEHFDIVLNFRKQKDKAFYAILH